MRVIGTNQPVKLAEAAQKFCASLGISYSQYVSTLIELDMKARNLWPPPILPSK